MTARIWCARAVTWSPALETACCELLRGDGLACRLRDCTETGVWPRLHAALLSELRRAGLLDLDDCSVRRLASPGTNGGSRRPLASRSGTPRLQASPDRRPSRNPARRHGSQAATGTMYPAPAFVGRVPSIRGLRGRPRRKPRRLYADQGYDFDKYRRLLWTATRRPPGPGARPRNAAAASRPAPSGDGRRRSGRGSRPPYIAPARDDGQAAASGPPGTSPPRPHTWPTVYRRSTQWSRERVWAKLHRVILDELGARGELDWALCARDSVSLRAAKGATDGTESDRPWQAGIEDPP
jgi:hypothetical protein